MTFQREQKRYPLLLMKMIKLWVMKKWLELKRFFEKDQCKDSFRLV